MTEPVLRGRVGRRRGAFDGVPARVRLTVAYAAGLLVMALVLAVVVSLAERTSTYADAAREARTDAEIVLRILARSPVQVVALAPRGEERADSTDTTAARASRLVLPAGVKDQLDAIPAYIVVPYPDSTRGFVSSSDLPRRPADDSLLVDFAQRVGADGRVGVIDLSSVRVLAVTVQAADRSTGIDRVVAAVPIAPDRAWPVELTTTVYVIVPMLIALATWVAWLVLGTLFRRVERVRREVADITDGRSLHRRVSDEDAPPEVAALVVTLNATLARLETSFMGLRRFTADASHELKTPLTVLRADVERAMQPRVSSDDRMVALEEALHETTRMAALVESLLTLARADEGRFDLHREPIDVGALAQEVYETALILGEGAGVTVSLPFTAEATVLGDRTRLRQLFLNLVTNAIKYTPEGGRVDIGVGRHPNTVTFAVRDTGIGIAAADLPHIFERFWRADRVRSRVTERGGFGLGLAISQWIAQAHGGTLTASSRLGKGSLFTVTLPLAPESRPPEVTPRTLS